MKKKSIVLLSGGLDSAANLAFCKEWDDPILALTFDYGQKSSKKEIKAAKSLADHFSVEHKVIEFDWLGKVGSNALTDENLNPPSIELYQLNDAQITEQTAKAVWVPNRNGIFIQVGAAFAEALKADQVVVGFNREEAQTFSDNSYEFIRRSNEALTLSTQTHVRVFSYSVEWDKIEIVKSLLKLSYPFPFEYVWSCYQGAKEPCMQCESCKRNERAMSIIKTGVTQNRDGAK